MLQIQVEKLYTQIDQNSKERQELFRAFMIGSGIFWAWLFTSPHWDDHQWLGWLPFVLGLCMCLRTWAIRDTIGRIGDYIASLEKETGIRDGYRWEGDRVGRSDVKKSEEDRKWVHADSRFEYAAWGIALLISLGGPVALHKKSQKLNNSLSGPLVMSKLDDATKKMDEAIQEMKLARQALPVAIPDGKSGQGASSTRDGNGAAGSGQK